MMRQEYIETIKKAYLEAWERNYSQKPLPYSHPTERDMRGIALAADEKIDCHFVLEAIREGVKGHRQRYLADRRIPAFSYFLSFARTLKSRAAQPDPAGMRSTKQERDDQLLNAVRANIEILRGGFALPPEGTDEIRSAALSLERLLSEAEARRAAGNQWVARLFEEITALELEFRMKAKAGIEECRDGIVWLRQVQDAHSWLSKYNRDEFTTWDIISRIFRQAGIPVNWTEKQK